MSNGYTIIWRHRVIEHDIAGFVVLAKQRGGDVAAITTAMNEIDRLLAAEPATQGESRAESERVLIVPPLTVTFEVHEEERVVYVLAAQYWPNPGSGH